MCVCVYIYIYTHTHTHLERETGLLIPPGSVVVVKLCAAAGATFAFFCSENEISIQPAALWTPQVPPAPSPGPSQRHTFKKKREKNGANGFFQIRRCQGDDQLRGLVCL